MSTQSESPAPVSGTSQKTLQLLCKRLRQLVRVMLVVTICLAAAAGALAIWWLNSLNGLPDIGDPFDVEAFRSFTLPDEQNAFTYLRRADQRLTLFPELPRAVDPSVWNFSWSKADPRIRAWVEANRQALELFRQGAEQSDAILDLAADPEHFWSNSVNPNALSTLSLLEGARRQESGDTAGAWDCYRSVLRMTTHVSRRRMTHAVRVNTVCGWLRRRLAAWAADPRTTISQLKSALDEVLKTEPSPDWDSFTLKIGYIEIINMMIRTMNEHDQNRVEGEWTYRLGDMQLSTDIIGSIKEACRFLLREPERSRRVVRLLWANWLAHVEARDPRRPVVRALLPGLTPVSLPLYAVSPDAPAGARALQPKKIASWLVTTRDVKLIMEEGDVMVMLRHHLYHRAYRELVITLATGIYRRERGALPPSEEALVGTYLKSLPDDGSSDLADEMTPTVE
jgi:hypothetical protein